MKKNSKGFTLIELLVVVAIIGILAAVGVVAYNGYTTSAKINAIKTRSSIKKSDIVIVRFGEKYKQWNAAFDAGYAAAFNKSIIVIHNEDQQHALKEIDAAASAVASDTKQVVRILKYVLEGSL